MIGGINRLTIAAELKLANVLAERCSPHLDLEGKRELAAALNDARRHLKPHEREELRLGMEALKKQAVELRAGGATLSAAAEATGLSKDTVDRAAKQSVFAPEKTDAPATVTGTDGKMYPAKKPRKPKSDPAPDCVRSEDAIRPPQEDGPPDEGGEPHPADIPPPPASDAATRLLAEVRALPAALRYPRSDRGRRRSEGFRRTDTLILAEGVRSIRSRALQRPRPSAFEVVDPIGPHQQNTGLEDDSPHSHICLTVQ